jgi:hypothetical protein
MEIKQSGDKHGPLLDEEPEYKVEHIQDEQINDKENKEHHVK